MVPSFVFNRNAPPAHRIARPVRSKHAATATGTGHLLRVVGFVATGLGAGGRAICSRASATARAEDGRSAGFLASRSMIRSESAGGSAASTWDGGGGVWVEMARSVLMVSVPRERRFARGHPVQDAAEAEQVAAVIDFPALGLLGRHVRRRADDRPLLRELAFRSGGSGQAEVQDLHAVGFRLQPDVGRLDVAVDQPALVGRRQSQGHLPADAQHLGHRELALALQSHVQRLAFEKLHGQEGHAAILADLVNGDDVVVLDRRRGSGLTQEALPGTLAGSQGRQHRLEGNDPIQMRVLGAEDDAHAPDSEDLQDTVRAKPAQFPFRLRRGQPVVQLRRVSFACLGQGLR